MLQQLLEKIALALEGRNIPYMVIGGQAVLLYGEPRLTRDIDLTLGVGLERWNEINELAKSLGWEPKATREFSEKTMVLPCVDQRSGIRLDLIFSHSPYERQAMDRVRRVAVGKAQVSFASPEDLIVHKVVAGRPRDLEDVKNILGKNRNLDLAYVKRWLVEFDASLQEKFTERFEAVQKSVLRK
ncbi:MAG TPA: nucleotidyl transferase AbiEii/AbiGii toxin family protein [Terriglobia bacterium]|nr:nucleotidyl transferase AbiEii/AbiGii toxin family protein [Terriglobia bacterium]